jgi:hypothetical protein
VGTKKGNGGLYGIEFIIGQKQATFITTSKAKVRSRLTKPASTILLPPPRPANYRKLLSQYPSLLRWLRLVPRQ